MQKSQATRELAREVGVSIQEAEHLLDAELFLDKYPRWDIKGPHHPIILHSMFLSAAGEGQKEAERFICQGQWQTLPQLDPKVTLPTIQLVGYQTSWKEIQDLYHEAYLLRRLPSLPPCRHQLSEEAIQDILSSLISCLWRWGSAAMLEEDQHGVAAIAHWPACHPEAQSRSCKRRSPHDKALWEAREAQQWALEAAHILELDIERLNQEAENVLHQHPCSLSGSHLWSRSLNRHKRSPSQCRLEKHVTFCNPEVKPISGEGPYREPRGNLTWAQMERGEESPLPAQKPEMLHP